MPPKRKREGGDHNNPLFLAAQYGRRPPSSPNPGQPMHAVSQISRSPSGSNQGSSGSNQGKPVNVTPPFMSKDTSIASAAGTEQHGQGGWNYAPEGYKPGGGGLNAGAVPFVPPSPQFAGQPDPSSASVKRFVPQHGGGPLPQQQDQQQSQGQWSAGGLKQRVMNFRQQLNRNDDAAATFQDTQAGIGQQQQQPWNAQTGSGIRNMRQRVMNFRQQLNDYQHGNYGGEIPITALPPKFHEAPPVVDAPNRYSFTVQDVIKTRDALPPLSPSMRTTDGPFFHPELHLIHQMSLDQAAICDRYYGSLLVNASNPDSSLAGVLGPEIITSIQIFRCLSAPGNSAKLPNRAPASHATAAHCGSNKQRLLMPQWEVRNNLPRRRNQPAIQENPLKEVADQFGINDLATVIKAIERSGSSTAHPAGRALHTAVARDSESFRKMCEAAVDVAKRFCPNDAPQTVDLLMECVKRSSGPGTPAQERFPIELHSNIKFSQTGGGKPGQIDWLLYSPLHDLILSMLVVRGNPADLVDAADQIEQLLDAVRKGQHDAEVTGAWPLRGRLNRGNRTEDIHMTQENLRAFSDDPWRTYLIAVPLPSSAEQHGLLPLPHKYAPQTIRYMRHILSSFIASNAQLYSAVCEIIDDLMVSDPSDEETVVNAGRTILNEIFNRQDPLATHAYNRPDQPWYAQMHITLCDAFKKDAVAKRGDALTPSRLFDLIDDVHSEILWFTLPNVE